MISHPMLQRELILASRRPGTYRTRFWGAMAGMVVTGLLLAGNRGMPLSMRGRMIFSSLAFLLFVYCLFAGMRYTADALSSERRDGTLGLLFLTDLRGVDVVFGKAGVQALDAVLGLVAVLPVLGLPLLLGGVTGNEFVRMVLALVVTLLFSLAVGLLVSAFGRNERNVTLGAGAILLGFGAGLPLLWKLMSLAWNAPPIDVLLLASPGYAVWRTGPGAFGRPQPDFWFTIGTLLGLAAVAIVIASWVLPRRLGIAEGAPVPPVGARSAPLGRWRLGSAARLARLRERWLDRNPWFWLLRRDRLAFWGCMGVTGVALCLAGLAAQVNETRMPFWMPVLIYGSFGVHLLAKVLVAAEAVRHLHDQRRSGALELLLCTPLHPAMLVQGQLRRTALLFLLPYLALVLLSFSLKQMLPTDPAFQSMMFPAVVLFPMDALALTCVGMGMALRRPTFAGATFLAAAVVLVPAWLMFVGFIFLNSGRGISQSEISTFFNFWSVVCVLYAGALAAHRVRTLPRLLRAPGVRGVGR